MAMLVYEILQFRVGIKFLPGELERRFKHDLVKHGIRLERELHLRPFQLGRGHFHQALLNQPVETLVFPARLQFEALDQAAVETESRLDSGSSLHNDQFSANIKYI